MAVTSIRVRRRVTGSPGAPASLKTAELAYNMVDGIFYVGYGDDGGGNATSIKAFAEDDYVSPVGVYQPIDTDLTNFAALDATAGYLVKTGANAYARRTLTGTAGRVTVSNGDGTTGNPTFDLGQPTISGSGSGSNYTKVTVDIYGRVTGTGQANLNDIAAPTGTYSLGAQLIQSSATPSGGNDLTNKTYVDAAISAARLQADAKDSVRVASTGNQALSGGTAYPTIDGVATTSGDRVLLRAQTSQPENGIYVVGGTAGAWTLTRAPDFDAWTEIPGASITVEEGSTLADTVWLSIANAGGTLGTTNIAFTRVDSGGTVGGFTIAGDGLDSSGGTVNVVPGTGITVASDNVALTGQALALHNVTTAADELIYATGAGTFATTDFTGVARTLLAQTTQALMRSTGLGLGTMSTQDASNVAITGGTIDGVTIDGGTF